MILYVSASAIEFWMFSEGHEVKFQTALSVDLAAMQHCQGPKKTPCILKH
jgi:hypothetical protein